MGRPGLTTHRKFRRLARSLGSPLLARGVLETIWDACYEAGDDYLGTAEDIDHLIGWTGERGVVAIALAASGAPEGQGFIEPVERRARSRDTEADDRVRYRVHDLWHHAPEYVMKRKKREAERRQRVEPGSNSAPVSAERRTLSAKRRRTADSGGRTAPNGAAPSEVVGQCPPNGETPVAVQPVAGGAARRTVSAAAEAPPPRARPGILHDTSHRKHAACGRVCLHSSLYSEFVRRRNSPTAEAEIDAFVSDVERAWGEGGPHEHDEPGDPFEFWKARYAERWPPAAAAARAPPQRSGVAVVPDAEETRRRFLS